jgi:hypothetical protein
VYLPKIRIFIFSAFFLSLSAIAVQDLPLLVVLTLTGVCAPLADSPRIYVSTNPWKVSATFQTISSTREEYVATIEILKASSSTGKEGAKKSKTEANHIELIRLLEDRLENIDAELAVSPELLAATTIGLQFRME